MQRISTVPAILSLSVLLASCATTPERFYENPKTVKDTPLCRAVFETTDMQFHSDLVAEMNRRGLTKEMCQNKVTTENVALAAVAVVGATATIAAACSGGGCAGGAPTYTPVVNDYDCAGGSGNGPNYVHGPVHVGSYDPYDLDRDGDGIGCEASDRVGGA